MVIGESRHKSGIKVGLVMGHIPSFSGYRRPDGSIGVRNKVGVVYTVNCSREIAMRIVEGIENAAVFGYETCRKHQFSVDTLVGLGRNPNIGSVLIVGQGCEGVSPESLADGISASGKPAETLIIQEVGGTLKTIEKGRRTAAYLAEQISSERRVVADLEELTVALMCGGSDSTSGVAANPAVGYAIDNLVENGGTVIADETWEMAGCAQLLAKRSINGVVAKRMRDAIDRAVDYYRSRLGEKHLLMSPGNVAGGLTTLTEKSLGAIQKMGRSPIQNILGHAEKPPTRGLYIMEGATFSTDIGQLTPLFAAGAQMAVFTTGRGSVVGHTVAPVIKICGNPQTYKRMGDNFDIYAGTIIEEWERIEEVGRKIFEKMLNVASGEKTRAEILGHNEFEFVVPW